MVRTFGEKWRPPLGMIVALVLAIMLLVPLAGIVFFRVYENQLIQATEAELISQSAAIAAITSKHLLELGDNGFQRWAEAPKSSSRRTGNENLNDNPWSPQQPELDLNHTPVLPERPDARETSMTVDPVYKALGDWIDPVLQDTQKLTLAGFRILDFNGTVIAGRNDIGLSFSHIEEVKAALGGRYKSVLRERVIRNPQPIYSISRGSSVRVFLALPIIIDRKVAGVVYASRTPSNILKEMYLKRQTVLGFLAFVFASTLLVGFIFARAISRPIRALTERSLKIGDGDRDAIKPLTTHGSREVHALSTSMLDMSRKLFERNDYINTFANHVTHELKSPLTSIQGAAELLLDGGDDLSLAERSAFLENILQDTERASLLLDRLRALARADSVDIGGASQLSAVLRDLQPRFETIDLTWTSDCTLPLSAENAKIVIENLVDNAAQHGATRVSFEVSGSDDALTVAIVDDGEGISPGNQDQIFDLFFTTRREHGGTGMGLGIIRALLKSHDATIRYAHRNFAGACFVLTFRNRQRQR
ncbi:HAMP domain-containing protein [Stappia sp. GBMRC 2046]|uniref:histidine kinase n=1 Tax=Stappia sediminis TaxID=2692190 RepID=A0A7X3LSX6_9HYPH|nr:ATP-binding protein [Stappia sediminis]MXN64527.1 HAMP domain-containing protein [Stappia sediminis]